MELLTKLKQISHYCAQHDNHCRNCVYKTNIECIPREVAGMLSEKCPEEWDLKEIERMLNAENS